MNMRKRPRKGLGRSAPTARDDLPSPPWDLRVELDKLLCRWHHGKLLISQLSNFHGSQNPDQLVMMPRPKPDTVGAMLGNKFQVQLRAARNHSIRCISAICSGSGRVWPVGPLRWLVFQEVESISQSAGSAFDAQEKLSGLDTDIQAAVLWSGMKGTSYDHPWYHLSVPHGQQW